MPTCCALILNSPTIKRFVTALLRATRALPCALFDIHLPGGASLKDGPHLTSRCERCRAHLLLDESGEWFPSGWPDRFVYPRLHGSAQALSLEKQHGKLSLLGREREISLVAIMETLHSPSQEPGSPNVRRIFTRQEPYDLVWTRPRTALAKEPEVLDVRIGRQCWAAHVPMLPSGYWAHFQCGKRADSPALPTRLPEHPGGTVIGQPPLAVRRFEAGIRRSRSGRRRATPRTQTHRSMPPR